jgi:hypothetical protein
VGGDCHPIENRKEWSQNYVYVDKEKRHFGYIFEDIKTLTKRQEKMHPSRLSARYWSGHRKICFLFTKVRGQQNPKTPINTISDLTRS